MKLRLIIIAFLFFFISCGKKYSETVRETIKLGCGDINITQDTFSVSIRGKFVKGIIYHDNYYLVFEKTDSYTGEARKNVLIVDTIGNVVGKVSLPNGNLKDMCYFDLSVEKDSLFIKKTHSFDESIFVLNESTNKFQNTNNRIFTQYEDNEYKVSVTDKGEFGSITYFNNKSSKSTSIINTGCLYSAPIVINRIDSVYYLTNSSRLLNAYTRILKIENLKQFENQSFNSYDKKCISNKRFELVLDTTNMYLSTCFVVKKKLLCIYTVENGTYIGEIMEDRIKPVYKFKMKFEAMLNKQFENDLQILSLYYPEDKRTGILTIDRNNLIFHVIN